MDPGEQVTGTRDEQYALVSVLYHALQGAQTLERYVLDAETAGDERLAAFFREAREAHRELAERAKGLLGVEANPATGLPPGGLPASGPPEGDPVDVRGRISPEVGFQPQGGAAFPGTAPLEDLPPEDMPSEGTTDVPRTPGAVPGDLPPEDVPPEAPREGTAGITAEDFDPTISTLREGVRRVAIGQAISEVEVWEQRLRSSGEPALGPVAENLAGLRVQLSDGDLDAPAVGRLLTALGEQVRQVAGSDLAAPVTDRLLLLGELLDGEGDSLSG